MTFNDNIKGWGSLILLKLYMSDYIKAVELYEPFELGTCLECISCRRNSHPELECASTWIGDVRELIQVDSSSYVTTYNMSFHVHYLACEALFKAAM